uniref:Galectin n=1 Tax=Xiphophorus couchianus TaxID=32473 RepID=A0A3B5MXB5_9TELE
MIVKDMSFKVGQTLTIVGVAKPDATDFAVNIGPDEQDITLHINPRFNAHGDENAVVCNSYEGGNWCEEVREGGFPFQQGEEFKVRHHSYACTCVSDSWDWKKRKKRRKLDVM